MFFGCGAHVKLAQNNDSVARALSIEPTTFVNKKWLLKFDSSVAGDNNEEHKKALFLRGSEIFDPYYIRVVRYMWQPSFRWREVLSAGIVMSRAATEGHGCLCRVARTVGLECQSESRRLAPSPMTMP